MTFQFNNVNESLFMPLCVSGDFYKCTELPDRNDFEFKDGAKQANEYTYDANGNLTKDLNKGITEYRIIV